MKISIELNTKNHSDYSPDTVTIEEDESNDIFIEFNHQGQRFSLRKSELRKVLPLLCEEE